MKRIDFENGQLKSPAYLKEDGTIEEAVYEGETPLSSLMMNKLQDNIEEAIGEQAVHKYTSILTSTITSQQITLPAKYKVRSKLLRRIFQWREINKSKHSRYRRTLL